MKELKFEALKSFKAVKCFSKENIKVVLTLNKWMLIYYSHNQYDTKIELLI
ncbi:unnamed protein product [Paramecium octaurelia]|uniref:Uncharacterized protein n=1 Tax=Paramecium octaurelia TaxID=43137 RepID=A0A8S1WVI7_PAROT|nr:unnamed protein product [Paramecium octaurelia]